MNTLYNHDFIKPKGIYRIRYTEPTEMVLRELEFHTWDDDEEWLAELSSLNGKSVHVDFVAWDKETEVPWAGTAETEYIIPFDCFEEYQLVYGVKDIDDSDVSFF